MEHPDISKINRDGFLGSESDYDHVANCENCGKALHRGDTVFELNDYFFCDEDCMKEAFDDDPKHFGAEETELD